jgi:tRNA pseudouridine38-40 synthase
VTVEPAEPFDLRANVDGSTFARRVPYLPDADPEATCFRAIVAYDGTDFLGFQWQSQGRTVQGALEEALAQVTRTAVRVVGSGRTDRGVHARGQVVGFCVRWRHTLEDLQRALNAVLPPDVAVLLLELAPEGWHPRFSAVRRHYRYTVLNQPVRSPLDGRYAHLVTDPLDLDALQEGAGLLVGVHDFGAFGQPTHKGSRPMSSVNEGPETDRHVETRREVFEAGWRQDGRRFVFDVVGNAFLRGMVRSMVGTLILVGAGSWSVGRMSKVLESHDRALAAPPAPACGLCLMRVEY